MTNNDSNANERDGRIYEARIDRAEQLTRWLADVAKLTDYGAKNYRLLMPGQGFVRNEE